MVKIPAFVTSAVEANPALWLMSWAPVEIDTGVFDAVPAKVRTPPVTLRNPPLKLPLIKTVPVLVVLPIKLEVTVPPFSVAPPVVVSA